MPHKTAPFLELKAAADGSTFEGYASVFHVLDAHGDIVTPGAFAATVGKFLTDGQVLLDHSWLIGRPTAATEDAKGLLIKGAISDTTHGRDAKTLLKDGVLRKLSIGYRATAGRPSTRDDVKAYWSNVGYAPSGEDLDNLDRCANYLRFLTVVKLYEVSLVAIPANQEAAVTAVKSTPRLSAIRADVARLRHAAGQGRPLSDDDRKRLEVLLGSLGPVVADLGELLAGSGSKGSGDNRESSAADLSRARVELALLECDPLLSPVLEPRA